VKRDFRALLRDEEGLAGVEFALIGGILCFLVLNGIDVARYTWIKMQVENAAQAGAQAAWKTCDPDKLPISKCDDLVDKVEFAIRSTSLKTSVSLKDGSPSEGYYCVHNSMTLEPVDTSTPLPADCADAGANLLPGAPGIYVQIDVTYSYTPLFPGVTVAKSFVGPIEKSAHMRLL
jgi:Flp pilus assembly pilin Flp